jgi:hypothetical protein
MSRHHLNILGYLVLCTGVTLGLWLSYHENRTLEHHLNSHETRDAHEVSALVGTICLEQNKVKLVIHLPPTDCSLLLYNGR